MKKNRTTLRQDIKNSIALLRLADVSPKYFTFVTVLALGVTVLSTYSIGILFPLSHGIITGSFDRVTRLPGVSHVVQLVPWFADSTVRLLILLIVSLYVVTLVKSGAQYYAQLHAQKQAKTATVRIRSKLLHACLFVGRQFYDTHPVSTVHHTFMRLPQVLEAQFRVLQRFAIQVVLMSVYIAIMFYISWQLALIVIIVAPATVLLSYAVITRVRAAAFASEEGSASLGNALLDVLFRMLVVQGFAKEQHELQRFETLSDQEVTQQFTSKRLINLIDPLEEFGVTTAALFVALGMAFLIHQGVALDASLLLIFFFVALQVLRSGTVLNSLRVHMAGTEPLLEQLSTVLDAHEEYRISAGTQTLSRIEHEIRVQHASFTYPGRTQPVLQDVSFTLPKGKVVALVGATGSGKSTIGNMLLRLYDCAPETIFIDGKDIRSFTTDSVRNRMSVVYQDPLLFTNTLAHNVLYASDEGAVHAIEETLSAYCLSDVATRSAQGIHDAVGDGAARLSGGQRRLVALVRAALREHDVLILDEATNSLDAKTEQRVLDEILANASGKIVLLISHRLSAIRRADHILFLQNGKIAESGTYDALMQQNGAFARLWQ